LGKNYIGFTENEVYETIFLEKTQFKQLDNGINSPWKLDLNLLIKKYLNYY
jgi:hypothetical protein